ncbi:MAG: hypothetical protein K2W85_10360 [Phycisphaerales bacterium]|nr:hypothetical protein [Phycisphaerales bacterium]
MTTNLRLRTDKDAAPLSRAKPRPEAAPSGDHDARIIPFPAALASTRTRLVGAKVTGGPFTTPMDDRACGGPCQGCGGQCHGKSERSSVIARLGTKSPTADITRTDDLIRGIERTMDRMQNRLDRFAKDADDALKFPVQTDDPGPRAA